MAGKTKPEDYLAFLQQLDEAGQPYFLEGGQAVNFWAEYFSNRERGMPSAIFSRLCRKTATSGLMGRF